MKVYPVREFISIVAPELVNDPEFKWEDGWNPNTFSYDDYDTDTQKWFSTRPEYKYEEGDLEDTNRLYAKIHIRDLDLD